MASKKKIIPGLPQTKYPKTWHGEWRYLEKTYDFDKTLAFCRTLDKDHLPYGVNNFLERVDAGYTTALNWTEWGHNRRVLNNIWSRTPEFQEVNNKFMEEYNSRPDLQEFYRKHSASQYYFYDWNGECKNGDAARDAGWMENPTWYGMYQRVVESWDAKGEIAKSVEAEFQEGDIVALRASAYGKRRADPLYVRWGTTPGKDTERIGTVMRVTDDIASGGRGHGPNIKGRLMEVLWFGIEKPSLIQERYIKFLERPTKKNGLKVD